MKKKLNYKKFSKIPRYHVKAHVTQWAQCVIDKARYIQKHFRHSIKQRRMISKKFVNTVSAYLIDAELALTSTKFKSVCIFTDRHGNHYSRVSDISAYSKRVINVIREDIKLINVLIRTYKVAFKLSCNDIELLYGDKPVPKMNDVLTEIACDFGSHHTKGAEMRSLRRIFMKCTEQMEFFLTDSNLPITSISTPSLLGLRNFIKINHHQNDSIINCIRYSNIFIPNAMKPEDKIAELSNADFEGYYYNYYNECVCDKFIRGQFKHISSRPGIIISDPIRYRINKSFVHGPQTFEEWKNEGKEETPYIYDSDDDYEFSDSEDETFAIAIKWADGCKGLYPWHFQCECFRTPLFKMITWHSNEARVKCHDIGPHYSLFHNLSYVHRLCYLQEKYIEYLRYNRRCNDNRIVCYTHYKYGVDIFRFNPDDKLDSRLGIRRSKKFDLTYTFEDRPMYPILIRVRFKNVYAFRLGREIVFLENDSDEQIVIVISDLGGNNYVSGMLHAVEGTYNLLTKLSYDSISLILDYLNVL